MLYNLVAINIASNFAGHWPEARAHLILTPALTLTLTVTLTIIPTLTLTLTLALTLILTLTLTLNLAPTSGQNKWSNQEMVRLSTPADYYVLLNIYCTMAIIAYKTSSGAGASFKFNSRLTVLYWKN